jgi:4'-phosphopantetheinyl transferase EntD
MSLIGGLFPAGVIGVTTAEPGDESQLLAAEAALVQRAVEKRRRDCAAGRYCARRALAGLGIAEEPLLIGADRQPLWPAGVVGSITHTGGFCAAVVAHAAALRGIGIDTEIVGRVTAPLWPSICVPEEIARLKSLPRELRARTATVIFSAKEAFYKAQYPALGERVGFHDVAIELSPAGGWQHSGSFEVHPLRSLSVAKLVAGPLRGRFVFHAGFVSTGFALVNTPSGPETPAAP